MAPSISKAAFVVSDILINISLSRPVDTLKQCICRGVHGVALGMRGREGGGGHSIKILAKLLYHSNAVLEINIDKYYITMRINDHQETFICSLEFTLCNGLYPVYKGLVSDAIL